jgi:hypothetical protein
MIVILAIGIVVDAIFSKTDLAVRRRRACSRGPVDLTKGRIAGRWSAIRPSRSSAARGVAAVPGLARTLVGSG